MRAAVLLFVVLVAAPALAAKSGLILDVSKPSFVGGQPAWVSVTVKNTGQAGNDLIVEPITVPAGWTVDPSWVQLAVPTGSTAVFDLAVTPPALGGSGTLEWGLYYDDLGPWNTLLDAVSVPMKAAAPGPDLAVLDVTVDPSLPAVGNEVTIEATLSNLGTGPVSSWLCIGGDIPVRFQVDGVEVGVETIGCGLDAWESDTRSVTVTITEAGSHTVEVVVDPWGEIPELDEGNNGLITSFEVGWGVKVTPNLPPVGAPGYEDLVAAVTVTNETNADLDDVWVVIEIAEKTGPLEVGWPQGTDLAPGESATFDATVDLGISVANAPYKPGKYSWHVEVWQGGLPGLPGAVPIAAALDAPLEIVPTVEVTADNILVPSVDPVAQPLGEASEVPLTAIRKDGVDYSVQLEFAAPIDFLAEGSGAVFQLLAGADVRGPDGAPVCDAQLRHDVVLGALLWRDLVVEHPWYKSTYVAIQQGFAWYQDEKHLKVVYWITQPFVVVGDLFDDLLKSGGDLWGWVKVKVGFTSEGEVDLAAQTVRAVTVLTKGWDVASPATQKLAKLSPLLYGEPYLADSVISERLAAAIDTDGGDLDAAVALIHDVIAAESPKTLTFAGASKDVLLKTIKITLKKAVKGILWTGIKKGFTAYFISKLAAGTALKLAVGEGSATLMAGLGAAGIAKGIASFGLWLVIDASIAYLTYVGTFVDNIRGSGGLIEAGETMAQSVPWTHVLYKLDGTAGPLDLGAVEDTFLAHSALFEVYGFINADLSMLKKLAFAKAQSQEFMDEALGLFAVTTSQRDFAVALEAAASGVPSPACNGTPETDPEPPRYEPPPAPQDEPPAEDPPAPSEGREDRWRKPPEALPAPTDGPPREPDPEARGETPPPPSGESPSDVPEAASATGCESGSSPGGAGVAWLLVFGALALLRRRRALATTVALFACVALIGCGETGGGAAPSKPANVADGVGAEAPEDLGVPSQPEDVPSPPEDLALPTEDTAAEEAGGPDDGPPPCKCDDGNACTTDGCDAGGACTHTPVTSSECQPDVVITWPPRAATMGKDELTVAQGVATSPIGAMKTALVNGKSVTVAADGTFEGAVTPHHGINLLVAEATDSAGGKDRAVQAALVGEGFYGTTAGPGADGTITNGLVLHLGPEVFDDDDTKDIDDLATLAKLVLDGVDLMALLPSPITGAGEAPGVAWCEWTIDITSVDYLVGPLDLVPVAGGMALSGILKQIEIGFSAVAPDFGCPDAIGTAYVASASISALITLGLGADGTIQAAVPAVDVELVEPVLDITGGAASLFDWLFNWFNGTFANLIESGIEKALKAQLAPTLLKGFESLAYIEKTFTIPALPGGKPVQATVGATPTYLWLDPDGATLGLGIQATTPKGPAGLDAYGSLARNGCFDGEEGSLEVPTSSAVGLAVHDDLLNEVLFAGWWGGVMHLDVPGDLFATALAGKPIQVSLVTLDPRLPPVLTSCTPSGDLELQVGDLHVTLDLLLGGNPATIEVYVSFAVDVALETVPAPSGTLPLGLEVKQLAAFDFEIVDTGGALEGSEDVVETMLGDVVVDLIVNAIAKGFVKSFPLPSMDVGGKIPGVPLGTKIGLAPEGFTRQGGYTVLTGSVQD